MTPFDFQNKFRTMDQKHNGPFMPHDNHEYVVGSIAGRIPGEPGTMGPAELQAQNKAVNELIQAIKSPNTPERQQQILHILNSNTSLMAAYLKHRQAAALQLAGQQSAGGGGRGGAMVVVQQQQPQPGSLMDNLQQHQQMSPVWTPAALKINQQELIQQQQGQWFKQQQALMLQRQQQAPVQQQQEVANAGNEVRIPRSRQVLQELMRLLRSPNTPEQQDKIINILRNNPPLVAAFVKQRQAMARQGAQHQGGARNSIIIAQGQQNQPQQQQHQPAVPSFIPQHDQPQSNTQMLASLAQREQQLAQQQEHLEQQRQQLEQQRQQLEQLRTNQEQWFKQQQALIRQQQATMLQQLAIAGNSALQQQSYYQNESNSNTIHVVQPNIEDSEAAFNNQCNKCTCSIAKGFECMCENFILCPGCQDPDGMMLFNEIKEESNTFLLLTTIQSLEHADQCKEANCPYVDCQRMKRLDKHLTECKRGASGGCPLCKQLCALCYDHAKRCRKIDCCVSFCCNIKLKLETFRLRQEVLFRRSDEMTNGAFNQAMQPIESAIKMEIKEERRGGKEGNIETLDDDWWFNNVIG